MIKSFRLSILLGSTVALMAACTSDFSDEHKILHDSHYWQYRDISDAAYQRGPKAQQMLSRDISRCVTEIRELERLGAIRYVTPADTMSTGEVPDPDTPAGSLAEWESPTRDGYLRAEHLDYHDFETCMMHKGWERVAHVPYDVAEESREVYIESILGQKHKYRSNKPSGFAVEKNDDYDNLNQ